MTGDPEDTDVRKKTLTSVVQRMEAMAARLVDDARKASAKGKTMRAAQCAYGAQVLRDEIEWVKKLRRKQE
jgi:hypothetical protein